MKRIFALIFLVNSLVNSGFGANIKDKIQDKEESLQSAKKLETQLNKKLDELASDIIIGERDVNNTNSQISELSVQVKELEASANAANIELNKLNSQNTELVKSQKKMENRLVKIISEDFAYDLIVPKEYEESEESIIASEVLSKLNSSIQDEVKKIAKNYSNTVNLIKTQSVKINTIAFDLKEFKNKQEKLINLQKKQKNSLADLRRDKEIYSKKLERLQAQQDELRKTLENLAILAKKQDEEKNEAKKPKEKISNDKNSGDIKQFGSSYKISSVKKYTGAKTIAPLDEFSIKQKFGDYTDPIYNIKIFNESIVLRSNSPDARVKSVLPGKVVYANDTAILEKVVIIENSDGIHTIYAHLNKIAPTIKVGSKIKQGYVIGRVARDLTFEVTQRNYHINPLDLISLR